MKITSKGQVTIPQEYRNRFGLLPDTEVKFVAKGKSLRLIKCKSKGKRGAGWKLVQRMTGTATTKMTTDQIMKLTRG
jgi:AbrB family looped-hinge helix DNA binding protein